ncbi:MAG: ADP-forming succinate--CoA ligase subunit beta [Dehalococcoidales bacterium]|jgi:succinyl-CoA synthetase beta subunit|nr:ADP-forming succinate--CoA ligase subunit beta [Dehalococcoidales bacterium]MDP6576266.1 ADP-forming succinate--CoA ligase subunit beta [Dehalococcoidales bacterium]|tara:strand:- start:1749 stop:2939 length:1191 start_codon:yes stop_codon:yes gene_type:complete
MKIHEYQAKELLSRYDVPVPRGSVAKTAREAGETADQISQRVVIKAQVHSGGRGKVGGIRIAETPAEAEQIARELLGTKLVTHQTGPEGLTINAVLVEEAVQAEKELYLGMLINTSAYAPMVIASEAGGMEIEEITTRNPAKILRQHFELVAGLLPYKARTLAYGVNLPTENIRPVTQVMAGMYRLFTEKDCSLVEINPLVTTTDGRLLALDAKINFDDNALSHHQDIVQLHDSSQEDPLEVEAGNTGVNYVKIGGNVGCLVNGAGLAMATMDMIKMVGGEPANFLDVGGGASEEQVAQALKILLADPNVKAAWINVFGGILRCDVVARAVVRVLEESKASVPFIVRMNGTNLQEAMRVLEESELNITFEADLVSAAEKAVAMAKLRLSKANDTSQ